MSILGLAAVIASLVFGFKSGNSDFFVLAGLVFIGTCILELPRLIHRNALKRMKVIADCLLETLENLKNSIDEENMSEDEKSRQEVINNMIKKYIDDENNS